MGGFAEWLWAHHRRHYPLALAITAVVFAEVTIAVPCLLVVHAFFDSELSATLTWGATGLGVVAVGISGGVAASKQTRHALTRWGRGDHRDPEGTWNAALSAITTLTLRCAGAVMVLHIAVTAPVFDRSVHPSGPALVAALVAVGVMVATGTLLIGIGFHLLLQPMLREVDARLPVGATPKASAWAVRTRFSVAVVVACANAGMVGGVAAVLVDTREGRFIAVVVGSLLIGGYIGLLFRYGLIEPTLAPVHDLTAATDRVRRGDYHTPVSLTSADELGRLALGFNEMQEGLAQREALHAAFGSYVDPALAQRIVDSGSSVFEGEDLVVSVLFADVRDFTSYSEGVAPAEAVELLNRLFDVIVPVLHEHGGHANHYLGDGLLAIFGAPSPLEHHADAAVRAAMEIQRRVREEFGAELCLGIGVNTGPVIAGTVGGGGRHEFTVIGDTVNVAARVEQLTKDTGDAILITEATRTALASPRPRSVQRGPFDLKGKSAAVLIHAVAPPRRSPAV